MCPRNRCLLASALLCPLVLFLNPALAAEPENVVVNGDFANAKNGAPVGWESSGNPKTVTQTLDVFDDHGNPCARLTCSRFDGKSAGWDHAMIAQVGGVRVEKDATYEFSCRARAENLAGRTVSVALQDTAGWQPCGLTTDLALDRNWQTYRRVFRALRTADKTTRLQFWFTETGTFYLDDVRIVKVAAQTVRFTDAVADAGSKNLVPNSSFEAGAAGWSSLGTSTGWGNLAALHGLVEDTGGAHGRSFLRIPMGGARTPVLAFDYYEPLVKPQLQPLAANLGWIPVLPNEAYTLSCSMRSSADGTPAILGVRARDPDKGRWSGRDLRKQVRLTKSWARYSFTFRPPARYLFVTIGPDLAADERLDVDLDAVQLEKGGQATAYEPRTPVELTVEPSAPSGIFTEGEPAALRVRACNHSAAAQKAHLDFAAADFFDREQNLPALDLDLEPGGRAQKELTLPADWLGHYRLKAAWTAAGLTGRDELRLAVVPRRAAADSILGINHAFATPYLIRLAGKAGVTWYRDWSIKWDHVEPAAGQYRWEVADPQIDRVIKEGFRVLPLLPPFPSARWNSEAPAGLPTKGYPGERLAAAWAPKEPDKLADFTARAVARYKDRIRCWEFLNEPIYTTYALPKKDAESLKQYGGPRYTPADYVRLLAVAAAGMKKSDPDCKVIAGISGGPDTFTKDVIEAGCLKHADIFNLHSYPGGAAPEGFIPRMDKLLALMDANGGRKPIWITEFSYYGTDSLPREPFLPDAGSWAEERLLASERQCAEYTIRFFAVMMSRGVDKIFIHSGASGPANEAELECCLFAYGGAPRKVFAALAVYTNLLGPAPKFAGEKTFGDAGRCVAFEADARSVLVLWTGAKESFEVTLPPGATCLDLMGRKVTDARVRISPTPVYVTGPGGGAKDLLRSLQFEAK